MLPILSNTMSLKSMFAGVVKTYDLLNRILTWGLDERWRRTCAGACASGKVVVDLCCGTGDLARHIAESAVPGTCVLAVDFSRAMVDRALEKKKSRQIDTRWDKAGAGAQNTSFILADAAHLPFRTESVDCIGISFSFRNLVYRNPGAGAHLGEVVRTLRRGGRLACVETSQPGCWLPRVLYHLYVAVIVPVVGEIVSGSRGAYRYLGKSARDFPSADKVTAMLLNAGFREASSAHLTFGAVALHVGVK